jgi:biopolymer transport protein ExbB
MKRILLLILALILIFAPQAARAWWNDDWPLRKKIVLTPAASGIPVGANLTEVPILLRLHAGNFSFDQCQESGADLRIVAADDKTPLPFAVEKFDWVDELAYVWVKLPKLGAADAPPFIWLYYGNPNAKAITSATAVWDSHQTLVYHFADREALPQDAAAFANHASKSTATPAAAGQIDIAAHYDGTSSTLISASPSLKIAAKSGFTFSAWIKPEGTQSAIIFQEQDGPRALTLALEDNAPVARLVGDDGKLVVTPAKARLAPDEWHLLAVTASDRLVVSIDGVETGSVAASLPDLAGDITIGAPASTITSPVLGGANFKGLLDEVRLANEARSADWLRLETAAEQPDTKLLAIGDNESEQSGSDYLATISVLAGAVTLDGWVVIALIGLLGFISGEVAIAKALMLRRATRANKQFLNSFRNKGNAFLAVAAQKPDADPSQAEAWHESPLFAIYCAGAAELRQLQGAQGEAAHFSNLNLEVVRAAVDTSLVNEANRINDKMVLLTLAVSGAPFLGLLGTVVGIMITFATIALKGDVNINTIAPGIAAAITATAAGMLVAIPALFGYNVLMTRIREVTSAMETFRDELLSKIAARYA